MMDDSRQPHQMLQHQLYKRTWREPPNPISSHRAFKLLWKKQRLAEMRAAILRGDWPRPVAADGADSSSDAEGWDGGSDSDAGSPSRQHRQSGEHSRQQQQHMQQDSEEDLELEQELQEAAAAQLDILMERVRQQHEEQLQAARAAAEEVEAEHTATTNQVAEIQARLDDLREKKHELFQQLKLANQAAAAAAAAAQQAAFQQQQRQWQLQQQQMPPPPNVQHPFHAASHGAPQQPFGGPGMHFGPPQQQQQQQQPVTPRLPGQHPLQPSSSGLLSPGMRPGGSPQQPPPPPPRHFDGAGGSGSGAIMSPSSQHHHQQQQYGISRQNSWAPGGPAGQPQGQGLGLGHRPLGRAGSDMQHWAASADRGGYRLERSGSGRSDRLERMSSSGYDGPSPAAGAGRDALEQHWQHHPHHHQQQQQQYQGPSGHGSGDLGRLPHERGPVEHAGGGRQGSRAAAPHGLQAPDSPEEGEALPSPPGSKLHRHARAGAAGGQGSGAAGLAGAAGSQHLEPAHSAGAVTHPSPHRGLERASSGNLQGGPAAAAAGGGYRAAGGYAPAAEEGEGGRGAVHGGQMLPGLRRSSSGGSMSGVHTLTSPSASMQRGPPRESPRGPGSAARDPMIGRRGGGGSGGSGGSYRGPGGGGYYPSSPPTGGGPAALGGSGGSRGREDAADGLPTPWQADRRRSGDGWDRFGGHQDGGSGSSMGALGGGKPWARPGGRGRGGGGGGGGGYQRL